MANSAQSNTDFFYTLQQAAEILKVSVETLIEWNESNILKPTITQSGKVVYKKAQVDKFLTAQEILQRKNIDSIQKTTLAIENINQINSNAPKTNSISGSKTKKNKKLSKNSRLNRFGLVSSFLILFLIISVTLFAQKNNTDPQFDSALSPILESSPNYESEEVNLSNAKHSNLSIDSEDTNASVYKFNETAFATQEVNFTALNTIYEESSVATSSDTNYDISTVPLSQDTNEQYLVDRPIENSILMKDLASKPNLIGTDNLSANNNSVSKDPLAINLRASDLNSNNKSLKQNLFPTILLVFLALSLVSGAFMLKSQLSYSYINTSTATEIPNHLNKSANVQNFVEVDQKTDGTVVMYLQGKELKISKPELNSESDQFIGRLLEYAPYEVKEINYNILKDNKIDLNAPLSKLVTRLGFVGTKRDLFFPRTSKNSVLFRRYLTKEDLKSMNLSIDQVANEFVN